MTDENINNIDALIKEAAEFGSGPTYGDAK
jgi:hypothetical protein